MKEGKTCGNSSSEESSERDSIDRSRSRYVEKSPSSDSNLFLFFSKTFFFFWFCVLNAFENNRDCANNDETFHKITHLIWVLFHKIFGSVKKKNTLLLILGCRNFFRSSKLHLKIKNNDPKHPKLRLDNAKNVILHQTRSIKYKNNKTIYQKSVSLRF